MTALLQLFFDICIFRKGPQDVPSSPFLFQLTLAVYGLIGLLLLNLEVDLAHSLLRLVMEAAMLMGFLYVTLVSAQLKNRLLQTAIAMLGTDAMISAFALPFLVAISGVEEAKGVYIVLLMLMLWHVAIMGHILRHALSRSYGFGLGLAIFYFVATFQVMAALDGIQPQ